MGEVRGSPGTVRRTVGAVVLDIEGTTSPTAAVHGQLFDDARRHLAGWVTDHRADPVVADALVMTRTEAGLPADADVEDVIAVLARWIDEDRKATALKTIEGRIWAEGLATGRLSAEFFPDVAPCLQAWAGEGLHLGVFSSGATEVQEPWFAACPDGDLTSIVTAYFDTANAGPKREPGSYARVASTVGDTWSTTPEHLLFLSDVPAELDAAVAAGWQAVGVRRPGEPYATADFGIHDAVTDFGQLALDVPPRSGVGR